MFKKNKNNIYFRFLFTINSSYKFNKSIKMKIKTIKLIFSFLIVLTIQSCVSKEEKLLTKFDSFINDLQEDIKTNKITENKWAEYELKFNQINNEFEIRKANMTDIQREKISSIIGVYQAINIKHNVKDVKNQINDVKNQVEGFIEEVKKK